MREQFRSIVLRYVGVPGAKVLRSLGITPNVATILGLTISLVAAALVGAEFLLAGGLVFLVGGMFDFLDGALARLTGKVSKFGAILDSLMDRLGEAALFLGMAIYGVRADLSDDRLLFFVVALVLALVTSQSVSYLRARGESLGVETKAGLMTRSERVVLLSLGLVLGQRPLETILIVIAAASFFTLLQRLYLIQRGLQGAGAESESVDKKGNPL